MHVGIIFDFIFQSSLTSVGTWIFFIYLNHKPPPGEGGISFSIFSVFFKQFASKSGEFSLVE
jgi:hypothetical protein